MRRRLTGKEQLELVVRAQSGDERAVDDVIRANEGLVGKSAAYYIRRCTHLEYEDLMQAGRIALLDALRDFDATRGYSWSTYAFEKINGAIGRALRWDPTIRIPEHYADRARKDPELRYASVSRSLDEPASGRGGDGDPSTSRVGDLLVSDDDTEATALRNIEQAEARVAIDQLLATLKPQHRRVVRLRHGLETGHPLTLQECGDLLGVSRERIRQVEVQAFAQIRAAAAVAPATPAPKWGDAVLLAMFEDGHSRRRIAETTGLSPQTIGNRITRARRAREKGKP